MSGGLGATNMHDHVPLHRLNTPQTKLWLLGGEVRKRMASNLAKLYPSGVGLLSATMLLFAYVNPAGGVRELTPPFKRFQMWQIANQPSELQECQCAAFFDPESGGAWRDRNTSEHHPFCQFERVSMKAYELAGSAGAAGLPGPRGSG